MMRAYGWAILLMLTCGLAPSSAWAWPVDQRLVVQAGRERFVNVANLEWAGIRDEQIASVERMEAGEWLVTGKAPGRTLLLLVAHGQMAVWSVQVEASGTASSGPTSTVPERPLGHAARDNPPPPTQADARPSVPPRGAPVEPPPPALLARAQKACPSLEHRGRTLQVTVPNEDCRRALLSLFKESDAFLAGDVTVVFELPALQANLRDITEGFAQAKLSSIRARYVGAGLVLEGNATREQHREALWTVFDRSVGRVPLDDSIRVPAARTDAGE